MDYSVSTMSRRSITEGSDIGDIVDMLIQEKLDELRSELEAEHDKKVAELQEKIEELEDELAEAREEA